MTKERIMNCRQYIIDHTVVTVKSLADKFGKAEAMNTMWEMVEKGEAMFDETWGAIIISEEFIKE